jgi:hypothetical protein
MLFDVALQPLGGAPGVAAEDRAELRRCIGSTRFRDRGARGTGRGPPRTAQPERRARTECKVHWNQNTAGPPSACRRGRGEASARRLAAADHPGHALVATGRHTICDTERRDCRRDRADSLNGNDGPTALVECGRDVGCQTEIQAHREQTTEIVDGVADGTIASEDDGLDLQDVSAHGARIADGTTAMPYLR